MLISVGAAGCLIDFIWLWETTVAESRAVCTMHTKIRGGMRVQIQHAVSLSKIPNRWPLLSSTGQKRPRWADLCSSTLFCLRVSFCFPVLLHCSRWPFKFSAYKTFWPWLSVITCDWEKSYNILSNRNLLLIILSARGMYPMGSNMAYDPPPDLSMSLFNA